jgi:proton-translocating NADH-quinone oxidoreductase chain L
MLILLLIFFPLFGSFFPLLIGHYFGPKGSVYISINNIFLCFLCSLFLFYNSIINEYNYYIYVGLWVKSGVFQCNWGFFIDSLTLILLIVVTSISLLVHIYSSGYMEYDPHLSRFMSYLSLFTFFMLILITADNFIQMFVGWEGVGFCSYLLINFWFTRLQANKAAIKAMLVNRVSDFALIISFLILFYFLRTVEYASTFGSIILIKNYSFLFFNTYFNIIDTLCIFLFIGAMGKSAQIFLHIWLPDAMEGPTPVSALIHAATMVTAGVFLITRCSPIFEYSLFTLNCIAIVGALTAFFASSVGLVQNDLKKVIAYSTCSQLGYMFFTCGLSSYQYGIFHLSNHAFFKALLFLCAGSVIHAMSDEQDMRKMGGLRRILPYTYSLFLIGSLSLMGFPFLTGFYSKDAILEISFASYSLLGHFTYWLGTISAFFTAFYSTRLIYLTFLSKTNSFKYVIINAHDAGFSMSFPLGILAFGSIFIGYLSKDMLIGLGTDYWQNSIYILPNHLKSIDAEFIPVFFKLLPVLLSILGVFISIFIYHYNYKFFYYITMNSTFRKIYIFLNRKWFFDKLYNELISQNLLKFGYKYSYKLFDKGFFELFGPTGLINLIYLKSKKISLLQTGYIYHYSFLIIVSLISFILILSF